MFHFFQTNQALVIVPLAIIFMVVALIAIIRVVAKNYIRVAPNQVLVIFGRKYKGEDGIERGFRLITGGAAFVIPLLESHRILPLSSFQIKLEVKSVPSKQGVRVNVSAVATLKIGNEPIKLAAAVTRFLDKTLTDIQGFAREVLEGALRGVVAIMTVEDLVQERNQFGAQVQTQVTEELNRLGLELDNLLVQEVTDQEGYIDAMGQKQVAIVKRDAEIGKAIARRDEQISVAESQCEADQKSSAARQAGEIAKAGADQSISDANREKDMRIAQNAALVQAETARVVVAAQIATQEEQKKLNTVSIEAQKAEIEASIELEKKNRERNDAKLNATVVVEAERNKEATLIVAEGEKQALIIKAEGEKQAAIQKSEGEKQAAINKSEGEKSAALQAAEGRKAQASADQTEQEASAAGQKAKKLAEAEGNKAGLLATAEGFRAQKLAEAEGVQKLAEAYALLDQTGKLLEILRSLPGVLEATGQAVNVAGQGTLVPMAQAIGEGLGNVKEIRMIDFGHGNSATDSGKPSSILSRFTNLTPKTIMEIIEQVKAAGLGDLAMSFASRAGIDLSAVFGTSSASAEKIDDDIDLGSAIPTSRSDGKGTIS